MRQVHIDGMTLVYIKLSFGFVYRRSLRMYNCSCGRENAARQIEIKMRLLYGCLNVVVIDLQDRYKHDEKNLSQFLSIKFDSFFHEFLPSSSHLLLFLFPS